MNIFWKETPDKLAKNNPKFSSDDLFIYTQASQTPCKGPNVPRFAPDKLHEISKNIHFKNAFNSPFKPSSVFNSLVKDIRKFRKYDSENILKSTTNASTPLQQIEKLIPPNNETTPEPNLNLSSPSEFTFDDDLDVHLSNLVTEIETKQSKSQKSQSQELLFDSELFDDDLDDFTCSQILDTLAPSNVPLVFTPCKTKVSFTRFLVSRVILAHNHKIICVHDANTLAENQIALYHDWEALDVDIGDVINFIPTAPNQNNFFVSNESNYIILEPDMLIPPTTLSNFYTCPRKAYLKNVIKQQMRNTVETCAGKIMHTIFQDLITKSTTHINLNSYLDSNIIEILSSSLSLKEIREYCEARIPQLVRFSKDFLSKYIVKDVEEQVWSPVYGLKGNIDASVSLVDSPNSVIPLEYKTGKCKNISHIAQVMIYSLILGDKYEQECKKGFILYNNESVEVKAGNDEIRGILCSRNSFVSSLKRAKIPPLLENTYACGRCDVKNECEFFELSGGLEMERKSNISDNLINFWRLWDGALRVEEEEYFNTRKNIWLESSSKRESKLECFSEMKMTSFSFAHTQSFQYLYKFTKANGKLLHSNFIIGDPIVISTESGVYGLSLGYLTAVNNAEIEVMVNKALHTSQDNNFSLNNDKNLYRIDKDDVGTLITTSRANIINVVVKGGDERTRRRIIDFEKPRFSATNISMDPSLTSNLNSDQKRAIRKVLAAGKTTTISKIVKAMVDLGKSVLLTSYTHSAVDNVLIKLLAEDVDFLRLGPLQKIHPDIQAKTIPRTSCIKTISDYLSKQVVAVTCLGTDHQLFHTRRFDYCIMDESSQIQLPLSLGPLRYADIFVLVGDQYQLPPLIKSSSSILGKSLFKILSERFPHSVTTLCRQYRMNPDILKICNTLVYQGKMYGYRNEFAVRNICKLHEKCWINIQSSVVFLNTEWSEETRSGDGMYNIGEADVISKYIKMLVSNNHVSGKDIGVISLYKKQIEYLKTIISLPDLEMSTVDKYQGRDKKYILLSLVRCNENGNVGENLLDWRRINVAVTRAQCKLIVVGARRTVGKCAFMHDFFRLCEENQWIFDLPKEAVLH